jgi:hypothetical protein
METSRKKTDLQDLKKDRLPSKETPTTNSSAGSSGAPSRGADATSKFAVEISAKGRAKPANQLAKLGSRRLFIGSEPACGISVGVANKVVRDRTETIKKTDSKRKRESHKDPLPEELRNC